MVDGATKAYCDDIDPMGDCVDSETASDPTFQVLKADLRTRYDDWCRDNGIRTTWPTMGASRR